MTAAATRAARRRAPLVAAALAAAAGALLLAAAVAWADERIVATNSQDFTTDSVTVDQGEPLLFLNNDPTAPHDVTAKDKGSDGKPLFASPTFNGPAREEPVEGSQYLTAGSYAFFCSVHPWMEGTLAVTAAGTPAPRPVTDTTPPPVSLSIRDAKLSAVRRAGRLRVETTSDEPATVSLTATARSAGRVVKIATAATRFASPGTRTVKMALTRAGRRALGRRRSASVGVSARATDAAGNVGTARAAKTLR